MCAFSPWRRGPGPPAAAQAGTWSAKGDIYIFLRLRERRVAVRRGQAHPAGPAECSRSAPTRVWTRGSSAGGAVSHSAPGGSVSALSARPAPAPGPCAWEVSAASASEMLAARCFRAAAGNLQPEPGAVEAGVKPPHWPRPSVCPAALLGLAEWRYSVSHPGPQETRLAALECRATSGTGLPSHTSVPHRDSPRHINSVTHSQSHRHTLILNDAPTTQMHTQWHTNSHRHTQAHSHGDGSSALRQWPLPTSRSLRRKVPTSFSSAFHLGSHPTRFQLWK